MKEFEVQQVKQAILNEIEGYEFYRMAMKEAQSAEVKEAFEELAEEELKHVEWLKEFFEKLKDGQEDEYKLADLPDPPTPGIFKWDKVDRKNAGIAVSVFGIGMQMEKSSMEFYTKAAEKTMNKEAKKLYTTLAAWEKTHYEQFAKEYEDLQHEWWSEQGYAPF